MNAPQKQYINSPFANHMDPISQGIFGVSLAQTFSKSKNIRAATFAGIVGGMLADVDVFIKSSQDPLLNLEFHRHFTHSITFIPIGGLMAALLCFPFLRKHLSRLQLYLFATLGYATAGFLDTCTTYGTHLLWPFNDERLAWSVISIIDPLFSLPLILLCSIACIKRSKTLGLTGFLYACLYLSHGYLQHNRALNATYEVAISRGHLPTRIAAHPSIGNQLLWRGIYQHRNRMYVDGYNIGLFFQETLHHEGESAPLLPSDAAPTFSIEEDSVIARDIARFQKFSDDWVNLPQGAPPYLLGDLRYATFPNSLQPLWGITVDPSQPDQHASFGTYRDLQKGDFKRFLKMVFRQQEK